MTFRPFQDPPFSLRGLQDEISRVVERVWEGGFTPNVFTGSRTPTIDLYEFSDRYVVYAEVPGLSGDDVEVTYLENALTIRGETSTPVDQDDNVNRLRGERRFGKFSRTLELPAGIDADRIAAKCHAGVLEVAIPKSSSASPKSVKVEVAKD